MTKLFASDFDGTLHFWSESDDYFVRPTDTAAIRAFQEEGGLFGVCTGRPLLGLTEQIDREPGIDFQFDFYIATTGAALFDRERRLIWNQTIPRELAEELYGRYSRYGKDPSMTFVCGGEAYWILGDSQAWPGIHLAHTFADIEGPFYGIAMENETIEIAQEAAADINERYGDVVTAYVNLASIDVVPASNSKGTGLRRAAQYYGATLTAGMGDSFNDLELLKAADVAYTFHSSPDEMHVYADKLVDGAHEAIYDFMRR
jgi:HAD superfamily hydrolase (TIGR01484 family)